MENNNKAVNPECLKLLIMSKLTKMAYINEERQAFLIDNKKDAEEFIKNTNGTYCVDKSMQKKKAICSYCFASGANEIVFISEGKREIKLLRERHLDKHYYNCRLSADITRLVHTQNPKYLRDFAECNFVVPIRIINSKAASIAYATVAKDSAPENYLYLAFTDLYEYEKWTKKIPDSNSWKPLQVDAAGLKRIGRNHGFIINIYGGRNVIKSKDLKLVDVKEDENSDD